MLYKSGFGIVDKVFLEFEKIFWDQNQSEIGFAFMFTDVGKKSFVDIFNSTF